MKRRLSGKRLFGNKQHQSKLIRGRRRPHTPYLAPHGHPWSQTCKRAFRKSAKVARVRKLLLTMKVSSRKAKKRPSLAERLV